MLLFQIFLLFLFFISFFGLCFDKVRTLIAWTSIYLLQAVWFTGEHFFHPLITEQSISNQLFNVNETFFEMSDQ